MPINKKINGKSFMYGLKCGIPIALGYLSVSFGFGISAIANKNTVLSAVIMSLSCLTGTGQVAALAVISSCGSLWEMALTQFVINIRYSLMSISLSQKMDKSFTILNRFAVSFGVTDEIFAVASSQKGEIGKRFMYGLMLLPYLGWATGTLIGASAGQILPDNLKYALGIMIYAMLIAIIIPAAKNDKYITIVSILAAAISCLIWYIPALSFISGGFSIIAAGVIAALIGAVFFPRADETEENNK